MKKYTYLRPLMLKDIMKIIPKKRTRFLCPFFLKKGVILNIGFKLKCLCLNL